MGCDIFNKMNLWQIYGGNGQFDEIGGLVFLIYEFISKDY